MVPRANAILEDMGYVVDHGVIRGEEIGIPQTRARHFTVAVKSKDVNVDFKTISAPTVSEPRSVGWVIKICKTGRLFRPAFLQNSPCDQGEPYGLVF